MPRTKDGDAVGVTEHDKNYLGTSPEYQNSAYEATAPILDDEAQDEATERVREHVEAMVQPAPEGRTFEDWVAGKKAAREGTSAEGGEGVKAEHIDPEEVGKDELLEEARVLGIEGRSSMNKGELIDAIEAARQTPQS